MRDESVALSKLQEYHAEHGILPSYSVLASLMNVSAKSWVAECVQRLLAAERLAKTPDGALKPGPRFRDVSAGG